MRGLTIHLVTPRVDPKQPGLTELYNLIRKFPPQRRETRHLLEQQLVLMSLNWRHGLKTLNAMGCLEWRVSNSTADLPFHQAQVLRQTQSARLALTESEGHAHGTKR